MSFLLANAGLGWATEHDTSGYVVGEPNVRAINEKLKSHLPEVSFILKQEIEVKGGKLISKKVLLSGVRVEEVKLSKIDPNSIRIDKFLGNSYYFITIFSKDKKEQVEFGYEELDGAQQLTNLDDFTIRGLENKGTLDHFCLSLQSKEDAEEVVKMIRAMIEAGN